MLINKQKKGVTIFELLIVIAAAVGIIAGALLLFSDLQDKQRSKDATANIAGLFANISDAFYEDATDGVLTNTFAIDSGLVPNGMQASGALIYNVWGGAVDITDNGAVSPNSFDITYAKVPSQESCIALVRSQRKIGWDSVVINGGAQTDMSALSITDISAGCNSGTDELVVVFTQD